MKISFPNILGHLTKSFISLFKEALQMMKNSVYFIVIALLVAELFKILIYACKLEDLRRGHKIM